MIERRTLLCSGRGIHAAAYNSDGSGPAPLKIVARRICYEHSRVCYPPHPDSGAGRHMPRRPFPQAGGPFESTSEWGLLVWLDQ